SVGCHDEEVAGFRAGRRCNTRYAARTAGDHLGIAAKLTRADTDRTGLRADRLLVWGRAGLGQGAARENCQYRDSDQAAPAPADRPSTGHDALQGCGATLPHGSIERQMIRSAVIGLPYRARLQRQDAVPCQEGSAWSRDRHMTN